MKNRRVIYHKNHSATYWAQRKKLRGKNKCFIFAVKKFYDYET